MIQYFAVRDAPKDRDGKVIALWKKDYPQLHLSLLPSNPRYEGTVNDHLIEEVDEYDFDVMDAIAEIPHIQSDGVHHYLGEIDYTFSQGIQGIENPVQCKLYAVVVDLDQPTTQTFLAGACAFEVKPDVGDKYDDVCVAEAYTYEKPDSLP